MLISPLPSLVHVPELLGNKEKPLIRDLIVEGLSLARTQKEEFRSILENNDDDINVLFKTLEEYIIK